MWNSDNSLDFSEFIDKYEEEYDFKQDLRKLAEKNSADINVELKPNSMQEAFIHNLEDIISDGKDRALLISATGTGKTYASAFAMRHFKFKRVLFLVHRNQLAKQAEKSYKNVFGNKFSSVTVGEGKKDINADYIFGVINTVCKDEFLHQFKQDEFDCIIIDEAHHSSANMYQKIMNYFKPKLWLGMTATPDRVEAKSQENIIYKLFGYNIAYEIRLQQAMDDDLLCPFHYFGVTDVKMNDNKLMANNSELSIRQLTSGERLRHIIEKIEFFGYSGDRVKGLIFCSRLDESYELSNKFNELGYRTIALSGKDSEEKRAEAFERLAMDEKEASEDKQPLDYIFSVDILNEGVDIVEVNQVVMLRPTESPIIFIQQLGRGLRKSNGKEYVVIIDFIGNYQQNFMIPVALSGDQSYNADVIKKFVISGVTAIPGASTIYFDQIAKEKIFKAVDQMKGLNQLIKESYLNLKSKLGKIPQLNEFVQFDLIDPKVIVKQYKTYFNFLVKIKEYDNALLTEDEHKVLEYLSKTIMTGWRYYELCILKQLLKSNQISKLEIIQMSQKFLKTNFDMASLIKSPYILNGNFVAKDEELEYAKKLVDDDGHFYKQSIYLKEHLKNEMFKTQLIDIVDTGLLKCERIYGNKNDVIPPFILYENYTRRDVCYLMNVDKDKSSTMYGKYLDDDAKNVFIFVTYNKNKFTEEGKNYADGKPDYADSFENSSIFRWDSQIGSGVDSSYMEGVRNACNKHLFVKKSDDEKSFYYMGTFEIINEEAAKKLDNYNKEKAIAKVTFKMNTPVREDILTYLESDIKNGDINENS